MSSPIGNGPVSHLTIDPPIWPGLAALRWRLVMWGHYESGRLPWVRARMAAALLRRGSLIRRPFHGNGHKMLKEGRLEIGRGAVIESNVTVHSPSGVIRIGRRAYISRGVTVGAVGLIEIGDFALIGPGCYITDSNHVFSDPVIPVPDQGVLSDGPTIIEDNVWLGANVVVTSGVRIGRRCVIGANSVVTRSIPDFTIAAGSPARVISLAGSPVLPPASHDGDAADAP